MIKNNHEIPNEYTQKERSKQTSTELMRLKKLAFYLDKKGVYLENGIFKNNIKDKDWYNK